MSITSYILNLTVLSKSICFLTHCKYYSSKFRLARTEYLKLKGNPVLDINDSRFLILFQKCYQKQLLFSFIRQFIQVCSLHFMFPTLIGCWPLNFPKNWPPGGRNLKISIFGSFQNILAKNWILDYRGSRGSFLAEFHGQ